MKYFALSFLFSIVLFGFSGCSQSSNTTTVPIKEDPFVHNKPSTSHYLLPTRQTPLSAIEKALADPAIQGMQIGVSWCDLEPKEGIYDFSIITKYLVLVKKYDKQLFVQFMERTFKDNDRPLPEYIYSSGAVEFFKDGKPGHIAKIWESTVTHRTNLLITELGKQFDGNPNFKGINFPESCVGFKEGENGFSWKVLIEQMKSRIDNAVRAFPNSTVIQYINYGPPPFLEEFVNYLHEVGAGMGGPDLVPDVGRTKHRIPAYDYYTKYPDMPRVCAVQEPNLRKNNLKGNFELQGFFDQADKLDLNIVFWSMVEGKNYKYSFSKDILPAISKKENN